ncbi:transposase, partial [Kingella kingae]|uniref:transposase n=1 Tax=Kingella kingae TaxID=504 RepID=UPI0039B0B841
PVKKYFCKDCCRNFIGDHNLTYKGCHSKADEQVWRMTVRGCGIRDIAAITGYSKDKVQAALDLRRRWGMFCCLYKKPL